MLLKLHITNYAIIHQLEIDFAKGFNIITGETGAGKSILLGALSLILGDRADAATLLNKENKCIVEGIFVTTKKNEALLNIFAEQDIELDDQIIIRREIATNGKSRAFVNDTPVTLNILKSISSRLVDLHQQFDTLELGEVAFQREVVDAIAGTQTLLTQYQTEYKQYSKLKKELAKLEQQQLNNTKELDYNTYQYNELAEAKLQPNQIENWEQQLKVLNNAEHIKATLLQITSTLTNSEQPIVPQLKQLVSVLKSICTLHNDLPELQNRLLATTIELDDIAATLEQVNDGLVYDADTIETLTDSVNSANKLLKKHNVKSTDDLLAIQAQLEQSIQQVQGITTDITQKQNELKQLQKNIAQQANTLHTKRVAHCEPIAAKINKLLHQVGMPNAVLKIDCTQHDYNEYGNSHIEFLFDANRTNKYEPLRKVASGGELSRLMLCIKSLVAGAMQLPVLIFDEIDTGISGEAAKQVGIIMSQLAQQHQVLCITHQAQIAAKATAHYFVYKSVTNNNITTAIKLLTKAEQITTIAQMLSGEKPTDAALENAKEMVANN